MDTRGGRGGGEWGDGGGGRGRGDWGEQGGWTEKRGDWGRERRDWEDDQWAGGQKDGWQGEDWLGWGDWGERRECGEGSDERSRSADWEGPGGRGPLPGGHGGGVKDVLRNVWLAAAGLSGGNWLLQVSLAAIGCCRAVALAPLLMVLLLWNILSAIFKSCCFSSNSLQVLLFLLVWFQTRTRIIQNCNLAVVYCYIGAADTGWH